jgi:hypothetical protein
MQKKRTVVKLPTVNYIKSLERWTYGLCVLISHLRDLFLGKSPRLKSLLNMVLRGWGRGRHKAAVKVFVLAFASGSAHSIYNPSGTLLPSKTSPTRV